MKTQLVKPARSKARYTDEYKEQALELWRASGRQGRGGTGHPAPATLPQGPDRASAKQLFPVRTEAAPQREDEKGIRAKY